MEESIARLNNRYELGQPLGTGGMAMVYRARDLMLERTVAIKLLRTDLSGEAEFRERFRQEARAAANLSHPNIVTVYDFGLDNNRLFIVMEYVPGSDLKSILQRRGQFSIDEAIQLMIQACAGIGYAHRAGLVHCDVKPQNMLVTPDRRLKVVDFGIARALASILPDEKAEVVWGSPQYFAPEQAVGGPPSPASDVYSLGVVLYEMLTGQLPFNAKTPQELARLHREQLPLSPRRLNPAIPIALDRIILKVLSKEPSARYRTADQFGRVLLTYARQEGVAVAAAGASPAEQPAATVTRPAIPNGPAPAQTKPGLVKPLPAPPATTNTSRPTPPVIARDNSLDIDWVSWILGLLALIAVGGLIPFWLWVYYTLNPPI